MRQCRSLPVKVKTADLFRLPCEPSPHQTGSLDENPSWFSQASSNRKILLFALVQFSAVSSIGQWSDMILGNASTLQRGKSWSYSVETKKRSSLANVGFAWRCVRLVSHRWIDQGKPINQFIEQFSGPDTPRLSPPLILPSSTVKITTDDPLAHTMFLELSQFHKEIFLTILRGGTIDVRKVKSCATRYRRKEGCNRICPHDHFWAREKAGTPRRDKFPWCSFSFLRNTFI